MGNVWSGRRLDFDKAELSIHGMEQTEPPPQLKRATDFEPPEAAPKPFFALSSLSPLRIIFFFSLSKRVRSFGLDCFLEGGIAAHGSNLDSQEQNYVLSQQT